AKGRGHGRFAEIHSWRRAFACVELLPAKLIGVLLAGVQLMPTLDALLHSARQSADTTFASIGSLDPINLLQLIAPYMFVNRVAGQNTHELGLYLGAAPLMLIVLLILQRRELGALKPLAIFAALCAVLALVLAFGEHSPLYGIVAYLPLVNHFRFPARYILLFQFAASVLTILGFLMLVRMNRQMRRRKNAALAFKGVTNTQPVLHSDIAPLWLLAGLSAGTAVPGIIRHQLPYIAPLFLVLLGPVLFVVAAFLVSRAARGSFVALVAMIFFTAIDLGAYGLSYSVYPDCPRWNEYLANIATPPGKNDGRVVGTLYRFDETGKRIGDQIILRGWSRADGYEGLEPRRLLDYRNEAALRVAGVRWVRRGETTNNIPGLIPYDANWFQSPNPLPRVRLLSHALASNQPEVDINKIDIDSQALAETQMSFPPATTGSATLVEDLPGRITVQTDSSAEQLLVLAESYHTGWKATLNGSPCRVYRVNGDYLGCVVPAGKHSVRFCFQPSSLHTGRLVSFLGLSLLPFCLLGVWLGPATSSKKELPS
ncbi:MAG: YfhO family protein, partial [Thermoguttaceae bacterium]